MKRRLLLIILFFCFFVAYGQQFYVNTSSGEVKYVTITNGSCSYQNVPTCTTLAFSIAQSGKTFYCNDQSGNLYKADIVNNSIVNCTSIGSTGQGANALTIDKDGTLYYVVNQYQLYKINNSSPSPLFLGTLPFASGGDLAFYKGELYMAASNGIVKVNLTNPSQSTVYLQIPYTPYGNLYGLVTVISNNSTLVYALGSATGGTNLIQLDMDHQKINGITCTLTLNVYDAASVAEGGVKFVAIDQVSINQQCDVYNKGQIQVTCKPDTGTYSLTFTLNNSVNNTTGFFNNLSPGSYSLNITSTNGAIADTSIIIPDYSLAQHILTTVKVNPICRSPGSISFTGGNQALYRLKIDTAVYPLYHSFTGLAAGNYHFSVLNLNGCVVDTMNVNLTQDTCYQIYIDSILIKKECNSMKLGSINISCAPNVATLTYHLNNTTTNLTGLFNNLVPGRYDIAITSAAGAQYEKDTTVFVPDYYANRPVVTFVTKIPVCDATGSVQFTISGDPNTRYQVALGSHIQKDVYWFKGLVSGDYAFTVLGNDGCIVDSIAVSLPQGECNPIVFPNTFTPNHDNVNEVFQPRQDGTVVKYQLRIYNRYGTLVFLSDDMHTGWDGSISNKDAPVGVYYWIVNYLRPDEKSRTQSGSVTLIR